jgi:hypothetical protein
MIGWLGLFNFTVIHTGENYNSVLYLTLSGLYCIQQLCTVYTHIIWLRMIRVD